jgi:uncharacterized coiled-coil protein SlyX
MTQPDINKITLALASTSLELAEARSTINELSDALAEKKLSYQCLSDNTKEEINYLNARIAGLEEEAENKDAYAAAVEREAERAIKELEQLRSAAIPPADDWTFITDDPASLPDEGEHVILATDGEVDSAFLDHGAWHWEITNPVGSIVKPIAWKPFPPAPKIETSPIDETPLTPTTSI